MRLPKPPNPQFVSGSTRIVSRRVLQLDDHVGDDAEPDAGEVDETTLGEKDVEDLYAKLDKIVSKRLKLKRVLEPSDETSSKRRKILRTEGGRKPPGHQQDSEPVVFRLVSKWLPPCAIHLTPKPFDVIPVREPPCEDTEPELRERVYRSTHSAIDLEQIKRSSTSINDWRLERILQTTSSPQTTTAPLVFLEIPHAVPFPSLCTDSRAIVPAEPSPHELRNEGVCCPIISAAPPHTGDVRKKGRRRGKPKNKNKLKP